MKEAEIQKVILDYLAAHRVLAFRMNTGAMKGEHKGKQWFVRYGVPGMADILAFPDEMPISGIVSEFNKDPRIETHLVRGTHVVWIEVKAPKGVQSELQKSFQKQVEEHGHKYILARCVEDVSGVL